MDRNPTQFLSSALPLIILALAVQNLKVDSKPEQFIENCGLVVNAGPDKFACEDDPFVVLEGTASGPGIREFYWEPPDGLSNPRSLRPTVDVNGPICYELVAKKKSDVNLVFNGDFSQGRAGFTTNYVFNPSLWAEGTYAILTNPQIGHAGFAPCGDHTTGTGPMMVLNGAVGLVNVWCQNITVKPNHDYCVFGWATSVVAASPAILDFTINGEIVGNLSLSTATCVWEQMSGTWNSGGSVVASYCVTNQNPEPSGNDFAIDDLAMYEVCEQRDTVCVDLISFEAVINPPAKLCCNNPIVTLDGTGTAVGPEYSYCWIPSKGGRIVAGGNTLMPIIDRPGIYKLIVKGPMGCNKEVEVEVEGNTIPPRAIANVIDTLDCENNRVRIFGGASPDNDATYEWKGPNGFLTDDQSPMVEDTGKYTLTVTDDCGCTSSACITVAGKDNILNTSIDGDSIGCLKPDVTISVTANQPSVDYEWTGPNGFMSDTSVFITGDTGWYVLKSTSAEGCEVLDSVYVGEDFDKPDITIPNDTLNCNTSEVTLRIISSDGEFYEWRDQSGSIGQDSTIKITKGGLYTGIVVGDNGCTDTLTIEVFEDTTKTEFTLTGQEIDCGEDSTQLCIDTLTLQAANFLWNGPGITNIQAGCIFAKEEGWYTVISTAENGCVFMDSIFIHKRADHPTVVLPNLTIDCNTPSFDVTTIYSNSDVIWTFPDGSTTSSDTILVSKQGMYSLSISSTTFECPFMTSFIVTEDFVLPTGNVNPDTLTCTTDSILLELITGDVIVEYIWRNAQGIISRNQITHAFEAGNYEVIIKGLNGCTDTIAFEVPRDENYPDVVLVWDTINCSNPNIDIVALADRSGLDYSWQGPIGSGTTDSTLTTNEAGQYILTIISPEGCEITRIVDIPIDTLRPVVTILTPDTLTCSTTSVNVDLGQLLQTSSNYSIDWMGPNGPLGSNQSLQVIEPGMYTITVTNANGCLSTASINVVQDTVAPIVNITGDTVDCNNISANLNSVSSTNNLIYDWIGPGGFQASTKDVNPNIAGNYTLTVTAENGCTDQASFTVVVDTIAPFITTENKEINCYQTTVWLNAITNTPGNLIWSGPSLNPINLDSIEVGIAGIYTVEVEGANGCISTQQLTVTADTVSPIIAAQDSFITCVNSVIDIVGSAPQGSIVMWTTLSGNVVSNTNRFLADEGGSYIFTAIDTNNGCESSLSINIDDLRALPEMNIELAQPDCDSDLGQILVIQAQGGTAPYSYSLDGSNYGPVRLFEDLNPGVYEVWIKDAIGCIASDTLEIKKIERVDANLTAEIELELGDSIILDLDIQPNIGIVKSISWNPSVGLSCDDCLNPTAKPFASQRYQVTVIDTNGCVLIREIFIKISKPKIFIPNVFSPKNGDGINDKFIPFASNPDRVIVRNMQIFSRWGELLFTEKNFNPNDPTHGWDGTLRDEHLNPGVFVFLFEFEFLNGELVTQSGDVTILD